MNTNEIEKLLERYYDGLSSLEDEKILSGFFSGNEVPDHLKKHAPVFRWAIIEAGEKLENISFQSDLQAKILRSGTDNSYHKRIPFQLHKWWIPSVAASALVILAVSLLLRFDKKESTVNNQTEGIDVAYRQTSAALLTVSGNFNHGLSQLDKLKHFDKVSAQLESFGKFFHSQEDLINTDKLYQ